MWINGQPISQHTDDSLQVLWDAARNDMTTKGVERQEFLRDQMQFRERQHGSEFDW